MNHQRPSTPTNLTTLTSPRNASTPAAGPNAPARMLGPDAPMRDRVEQILSLIRPAVQADGGDLELVDVTPDGIVAIRLHGACVGCPSSSITLQTGIERNLKDHVPEVRAVRALD